MLGIKVDCRWKGDSFPSEGTLDHGLGDHAISKRASLVIVAQVEIAARSHAARHKGQCTTWYHSGLNAP